MFVYELLVLRVAVDIANRTYTASATAAFVHIST